MNKILINKQIVNIVSDYLRNQDIKDKSVLEIYNGIPFPTNMSIPTNQSELIYKCIAQIKNSDFEAINKIL